jgi:hypothetical protein
MPDRKGRSVDAARQLQEVFFRKMFIVQIKVKLMHAMPKILKHRMQLNKFELVFLHLLCCRGGKMTFYLLKLRT